MAEATVVYRAIADFAALKKDVRDVRRELRELRTEQEAYNDAQKRTQDRRKLHQGHTDALKREADATDDATQSVRDHTAAALAQAQAQRRAERAVRDYINSQTASRRAAQDTDRSLNSNVGSYDDLVVALRAATEAMKEWSDQARRSADDSARSVRGAVDDIARSTRRANALPPIVGNNLRGGTRTRVAGSSNTAPPGGGGGGGGFPDPDPGGRARRSLNGLIGAASRLTGVLGGLGRSFFKFYAIFGLIAGAAGPLIAILGALGSAAAAVAGALGQASGAALALPGAFAVGILAISALVVALRGTMKVFQAYSAQQKAQTQEARAAADAQRLSARQIADAQRALSRAREDAARAAEDAAERVSDAVEAVKDAQKDAARAEVEAIERVRDALKNLKRAREDAARAAEDAAERVSDAERALVKAQQNVLRAQRDLNEARKEALQDLINLREEVSRGALDEEAAVAALARAQEAYQNVLADPGSTQADQLTALYNLHRAEQDLKDIRQKRAEDDAALAQAEKNGIKGAKKVIDAQEGVKDADERLSDSKRNLTDAQKDQARSAEDAADRIKQAEKDLKDAQEDRTRTAEESADRIRDAQERLRDAQEDQARGAEDAAERIEDAQRNLAEAIEDSVARQKQQSAATTAYEEALAKLSPSARKFVLGLIAMKGAWDKLRMSVQEAFFKSLVTQLDAIRDSLPFIEANLVLVAEALGEVVTAFVAWLTDPNMRPFFASLAKSTAQIIRLLGPGLISTLNGLVALIRASLPFLERWAAGFSKGAAGFEEWAEAAEKSGRLAAIFEKAGQRLGEFWDIIKNLTGAFFNLAEAADEFNTWIMTGLVNATERFEEFTAAQKVDGSPFKQYLEDIKPLLQETGKLLKAFVGYLGTEAADPKNIASAIDIFRKLREEMGPALADLFRAFRDRELIQKFMDVITAVANAFTSLIESGGGAGFEAFLGFLESLFKGFQWLIDHTPDQVITAISLALGTLATMRFTGVLGLLRTLTAGGTLSKLQKVGAALGLGAAGGVLATGIKQQFGGGEGSLVPAAVSGTFQKVTSPFDLEREVYREAPRPLDASGRPMAGPVPVTQVRQEAPRPTDASGRPMAGPMPMVPVKERTPLGKVVDDVGEALSEGWEKLKKFGSALKRLFGPDVMEIWDTLKEKVGGAFKDIKQEGAAWLRTLKNLWPVIKTIAVIVGTVLLGALKVISTVLKNVVGPAFDLIWDSIKAVSKILRGFVDFVSGLVTGDWGKAWEGIKDVFSGAWDAIVSIFKNIPKILWGIVKGLVEGIIKFFKWLWDELVGHSIIPDMIDEIVDWFKKLPGMLLDAIKKLPGLLWNAAKFALQKLWDGLVWVWGNVLWPWIKDLPGNFLKGLGNIATFLWEAGKKLLRGLWNGVKWLWDNVLWPWIKAFPENFLKGLGNIATFLWEAGKKLLRGLLDGIKWLWSNVLWPWIKDVPSNILKGLGSLGKLLVDAGKSLMEGFRSGIESAWNGLKGWLGKTLKSGIQNLFKDPVSFLINTVINGWIIGNINKLLKHFGVDIPTIPDPFAKAADTSGAPRSSGGGSRMVGGRFAKGDRVPGTGNKDTVPAMLTPGEFVIRKKSVQKLGLENLRHMNVMGQIPQQYAFGDLVSSSLSRAKKLGGKAISGVKAGADYASNVARNAAGKAFNAIVSPLRGILSDVKPQVLGIPGKLGNYLFDKAVNFVKGVDEKAAAARRAAEEAAFAPGAGSVGGGDWAAPTGPTPTGATDRGRRAIEWARNQSLSNNAAWYRMCLRAVRTALGVGAKNDSATQGWYDTEMRMGTGTPPPGVPVWWTGGQWGHVALSDGAGNAWSNDYRRRGMIDRHRISDISRDWGFDYKGWTRDINDVQVYKKGGLVAPPGVPIDKFRPWGMSREEIRKYPQNLGFADGGPVPYASLFNAGGLAASPNLPNTYGLSSVPTSIQNHNNGSRSMQFGDINIHNPVAEPASESIPRSIRKVAYLGAAG